MKYQPTIGLEIHAELKTRTKMFCDSPSNPDEKHPNVNVCPVCLAHPGTLPVINKKAVEHVIRVGLALGGKINSLTKFDRKNYFYPDLPKGYQISQYDKPLVSGGSLKGVRLTRIHLEEDTGRLVHVASKEGGPARSINGGSVSGGKNDGATASLVDFNRAGIPLMELVTEPDITTAEQAGNFARELQLILRYLGVSDADMEKGNMRLEANVSIRKTADERGSNADLRGNSQRESASSLPKSALGTKVEVKNINSFRAVESAIAYELERQKEVLEQGGKVKQETRGWDDVKKKTVSQRSKEEAHDYRYFPEPDLPPFETDVFGIEELKYSLPELPAQKRERFMREFGLNEKQVEVLISSPKLAEFFEEAVSELKAPRLSAILYLYNIQTSPMIGMMNEDGIVFEDLKIDPEKIAHLATLGDEGKIGSAQVKVLLKKMLQTGLDPEEILTSEGLETVSDEAELMRIVAEVLKENSGAVADYKKGKEASMQFLIGKAMAKLRGRGNSEALKALFLKDLTA